MKIFFVIIFLSLNAFSFEIEKYSFNRNGKILELEAVKGEAIFKIEKNKDEAIKKIKEAGYEDLVEIYKNIYLGKSKNNFSLSSFTAFEQIGIKAYPNRVFKTFYFPNDPYVSKQWHLSKINAFPAWDFEEYKSTVTVFVLDTGVDDSHEDLAGVLYSTQTNVDINNQSVTADLPPFALSGSHGTMVSGTIAALRDNLKGISGVAGSGNSKIKIYSMNVFYGGSGNETNEATIIKALSYIKTNLSSNIPGKKIVNMSLGGPGNCSDSIQVVIDDLYNDNFIIVAAAGNDAMDVAVPANCANVVPVSATDQFDKLTYFSNFGDKMLNGLSAPGASIYTTIPNDGYESVDGTSFSAPIVSAVMGMVWGKKPDFKNSDVISIVKRTAYDIGGDGPDKKYGWGRVDVFKALSYIESNLNYKGVDKSFVAWPNPFSVSKDGFIKFSVKDSAVYPDDKLMIFDFSGNFIANAKKDGVGGFMWDGKNDSGVLVAPGPYVAYYKSEKGRYKTKFLLMR
ncbi:MAG: S8 family serine peptidase [Elusimicrobiales bacterium]|nr:S8 family serine peptidase [Elusimicrobiales bacterium]HPO95434.1 S8 family serine peptidase [Elusimicrobiales bacterium]